MSKAGAALVALVLLAGPAGATQSTLIQEETSRNCTIDQDTVLRALPNVQAAVAAKAPALTQVHILGGQEFGPPVAFPHTEEEYARVWFHVRTDERKVGWAQSNVVDCGD